MDAADDRPTNLLHLPSELLLHVAWAITSHGRSTATELRAFGDTCVTVRRMLQLEDALWATAARHSFSLTIRPRRLQWRVLVGVLVTLDRVLRPHVAQAPSPTSGVQSRRLRCHSDPASASLALKLYRGSHASYAQPPTTGLPSATIHPLSQRELRWLHWFARMQGGTLIPEDFRSAQHGQSMWLQALHLHDESNDCMAVALQPDVGSPLCFPCSSSDSHSDRLRHTLCEFRHRLRLMQRLFVLCEAVPAQERVLRYLSGLPRTVCMHASTKYSLDDVRLRLGSDKIASGNRNGDYDDGDDESATCPPAVLLIPCELVRSKKLSIAGAMELVGRVVQLLVEADRNAPRSKATIEILPPMAVRAVAFVTTSPKAAETFEKATRSIAFKSHMALDRRFTDVDESALMVAAYCAHCF